MTFSSESTTTKKRTATPGPFRWWLLALGAVVTMSLLTWGFAASVQRSTVADASAALADAGLTRVTVEGATYRDLVLTGPAADEAAALAAVEGLDLSYKVTYKSTGGPVEQPAPMEPSPSAEPIVTPSPSPEPSPSPAPSEEPVELPGLPTISGVQFETSSATITEASKPILDSAAVAIIDALASRPSLKVSIEGHTDSAGDDAANLALSAQRASAVLDYLVSKGVPAASLTSVGYGETAPIADNATNEGRAANRRVEFVITEG